MREKLKGTHHCCAETGTIDGKGVIFFKVASLDPNSIIVAYVYKHDRTRLRILQKQRLAKEFATRKGLILFLNEYGAYKYEEKTRPNVDVSLFYHFLNTNYGFDFTVIAKTKKTIKKIQKELTGLSN